MMWIWYAVWSVEKESKPKGRAECGKRRDSKFGEGTRSETKDKTRQEKSGRRIDRGLVEAVDAQSAAALKRLVTWWRSCGSSGGLSQGKSDSSVCRVCIGKVQIHVRASRLCVLLGACQTELPSNNLLRLSIPLPFLDNLSRVTHTPQYRPVERSRLGLPNHLLIKRALDGFIIPNKFTSPCPSASASLPARHQEPPLLVCLAPPPPSPTGALAVVFSETQTKLLQPQDSALETLLLLLLALAQHQVLSVLLLLPHRPLRLRLSALGKSPPLSLATLQLLVSLLQEIPSVVLLLPPEASLSVTTRLLPLPQISQCSPLHLLVLPLVSQLVASLAAAAAQSLSLASLTTRQPRLPRLLQRHLAPL